MKEYLVVNQKTGVETLYVCLEKGDKEKLKKHGVDQSYLSNHWLAQKEAFTPQCAGIAYYPDLQSSMFERDRRRKEAIAAGCGYAAAI